MYIITRLNIMEFSGHCSFSGVEIMPTTFQRLAQLKDKQKGGMSAQLDPTQFGNSLCYYMNLKAHIYS
jgi:hypothetical protein